MTACRQRVAREDRVAPTPQTVAHLRPDAVQMMLARRQIDQAEAQAAEEIRAVYEAIVGTTPAVDYLADRGRGAFSPSGERLARLAPPLEALWRDLYRPWAAALSVRFVPTMRPPRCSELSLALDLAVDNLSPSEIAMRRAVGPNAARALVVNTLALYVALASGQRRHDTA